MGYDYDKLYDATEDALGEPTQIFVDFFDGFATQGARVLDVGCGQGRDALFIARKGHRVVGMDLAPNGIRDLTAAAAREGLEVEGIVADLTDYTPEGHFDVIVIDRTLHMLPQAARNAALARLLDHLRPQGWVLIADEASNMPDFKEVIAGHAQSWTTELDRRGILFVRQT